MKTKSLTAVILFAAFACLKLSAHEEPAKTLNEKKEKEEKREKIIKNNTSKIVMWKHAVNNGEFDKNGKEKFIESNYDNLGNLVEMNVYKPGDSLDYKVVFTFDESNNMLTDTDYNPDGVMSLMSPTNYHRAYWPDIE